ncbi:MAG: alpha/beta hydrolase [Leptolyngbyaceae cyanobacterium]
MTRFSRYLPLLVLACLGTTIGAFPRRVAAAEQIVLRAGLLEQSVSIQSLAGFAKTGSIDSDLKFYSGFIGKARMEELRQLLQHRFKISPVVVSQLTYAPLGEAALEQVGSILRADAGTNGFYAIRAALIQAAANPAGFTLIDVMQAFPANGIYINIEKLLQLQRSLTTLVGYTDTTVKAITKQAQQEAASAPADFFGLPDPIKPGPFKFSKSTVYLQRMSHSVAGAPRERRYYVDLYLPEGMPRPAPIVLISHGLGSSPAAFAYLGTHLASHGFAVAIPEHLGSGAQQARALITGLSSHYVRLNSFVERPLDIKQVIDYLETRSQTDLAGRLDLSRIGVMGHSFGGYTALISAGATLNLARIHLACTDPMRVRLDLSYSFQCLNEALPKNFDTRFLGDARIKASLALNPVASVVFGPEGMGTLKVPTMLVGGSADIIAPLVIEQVNPFFWLKIPDKFLTVIIPAGHTAADATGGDENPLSNSFASVLSGPDPILARQYIQALAIVFMQTYIGEAGYRRYLNAGYSFSIQQPPLQLNLVQSLTPQMLEQAYGGAPPLPFFPPLNR